MCQPACRTASCSSGVSLSSVKQLMHCLSLVRKTKLPRLVLRQRPRTSSPFTCSSSAISPSQIMRPRRILWTSRKGCMTHLSRFSFGVKYMSCAYFSGSSPRNLCSTPSLRWYSAFSRRTRKKSNPLVTALGLSWNRGNRRMGRVSRSTFTGILPVAREQSMNPRIPWRESSQILVKQYSHLPHLFSMSCRFPSSRSMREIS